MQTSPYAPHPARLPTDWLPVALQGPWTQTVLGLGLLALAALLGYLLTRRYLLALIHAGVRRSRTDWDETLFEHRAPHRAALLVPLLILQIGLPWVPGMGLAARDLATRVLSALMIWATIRVIDAAMSGAHAIYARLPTAQTRPIKSYVQLAKVILYAFGIIFVIARLAGQSPWFFVSGLGAAMAVILLVFRDTLLSLVASVQLTNNDLIRVGDWIEMPQFGADGDVVDIALNTVRVQNWDKTISVIPTHKFLEHSFKNWRGMQESGGRRIKRSIHINTSTVRFLGEDEIERFGRLALLSDYIAEKTRELAEHNERVARSAPGLVPNARRLTNLGTLRAYVAAYLRQHPKIHSERTFLVRQLTPTPEGIPLEIYVFSNDIVWANYEAIQADIFDHILAVVPEFGLSIYQRPSGADLARAEAA